MEEDAAPHADVGFSVCAQQDLLDTEDVLVIGKSSEEFFWLYFSKAKTSDILQEAGKRLVPASSGNLRSSVVTSAQSLHHSSSSQSAAVKPDQLCEGSAAAQTPAVFYNMSAGL